MTKSSSALMNIARNIKAKTFGVIITALIIVSLAIFIAMAATNGNLAYPLTGGILMVVILIASWAYHSKQAEEMAIIHAALSRLSEGDVTLDMSEDPVSEDIQDIYRSINDIRGAAMESHRLLAEADSQIQAIGKAQAVIEFDMEGMIITANDNFLRVLGYSLDEVQGRHHSMFVEPSYKESSEYREFWLKLNRGEFESNQYQRLGKGGKAIWIEASYNPIFDENGKPVKVVKYASDITAQKLLAGENQRIKIALDNASTNVMVADADLNIVYMNKTLIKMMQQSESDLRKILPNFNADKLIGTNIDIFHKNPAHQRGILKNLTSTVNTNIKVGAFDFNLIVNPVSDANGEQLGTVVEWKDMTEELAIEEEINVVVNAAAAGDFTKRISTEDKEGFMLSLAHNINTIGVNTQAATDDLVRVLGELAKGNLTEKIEADYEGTFDLLKNSSNETACQLMSIVGQVNQSAAEVATASAELSTGSDDLSRRTEAQASSLEETAASMEELAVTVKQNSENAEDANKLAEQSREMANDGGEIAKQAVEAMSVIENSSQQVSDIIGVIDDLAFQTNLLALNAAVEAARAGEAGKGFAVVAEEVRTLAQRSAQASNEIKSLITSSNTQVKNGVELVNKAGASLSEIRGSIAQVAEIVAEIASASSEQAQGIDEVNVAIAEMDDMTQQNSSLVEQSTASARVLEGQATEMQRLMSFFKIGEMTEQMTAASTVQAQQSKVKEYAAEAQIMTPVMNKKKAVNGAGVGWSEF
ncbi:MAG: methyl-accepting chemotaxis protein [Emcibacter sp.]|nr:methyl-accepting chemotaxis protein [Emcibacter sp.]